MRRQRTCNRLPTFVFRLDHGFKLACKNASASGRLESGLHVTSTTVAHGAKFRHSHVFVTEITKLLLEQLQELIPNVDLPSFGRRLTDTRHIPFLVAVFPQ
jgi:hypothetical protein